MENCPKCQSPIKTVPAGVSKRTGQPYNAFQACSNRDCDTNPAILKCFTADFLKSNLDLFQDSKALPQQKITRFLKPSKSLSSIKPYPGGGSYLSIHSGKNLPKNGTIIILVR